MFNESTIYNLIEEVGTLAFAISGIRMASTKKFDLFGAYVIGLTTAIGGGTIRDLLLDVPPFWMQNISYIIVTALALVVVICLGKHLLKFNNTFFIFDTIGLALFTVVGIEKTLEIGYPFWVAIIMGTITGSAGGILRDVLTNEVPLIFRKDIYAMACVIGGLFFWLFDYIGWFDGITHIAAAISIILTRVISVKYHLTLPRLK